MEIKTSKGRNRDEETDAKTTDEYPQRGAVTTNGACYSQKIIAGATQEKAFITKDGRPTSDAKRMGNRSSKTDWNFTFGDLPIPTRMGKYTSSLRTFGVRNKKNAALWQIGEKPCLSSGKVENRGKTLR